MSRRSVTTASRRIPSCSSVRSPFRALADSAGGLHDPDSDGLRRRPQLPSGYCLNAVIGLWICSGTCTINRDSCRACKIQNHQLFDTNFVIVSGMAASWNRLFPVREFAGEPARTRTRVRVRVEATCPGQAANDSPAAVELTSAAVRPSIRAVAVSARWLADPGPGRADRSPDGGGAAVAGAFRRQRPRGSVIGVLGRRPA